MSRQNTLPYLSVDNGLSYVYICCRSHRGPAGNISAMSHGHHGVQNHWLLNCMFNSMFKVITKKISKPCITGPLRGESTGNWWILFTRESISMSWHHYGYWVSNVSSIQDDVIKWKHFPRYLTFTRINGWVNNGEAGNSRRHHAHYDVIVTN